MPVGLDARLVGAIVSIGALVVLGAVGLSTMRNSGTRGTVNVERYIDKLEESVTGLNAEKVGRVFGGFSADDVAATSGEAPFVVDGNRIYAELGFVRPDGSVHRALAYVDMGSQFMDLRASLYDELQVAHDRSLSFRVGRLPIEVAHDEVLRENRPPSSLRSALKVEATLPASILQRYRMTIDYKRRTLALGPSGAPKPDGVQIPLRINPRTGLVAIDVSIAGRAYPLTIDNGSAYTWVRQSTASEWLQSHPDWNRGVGAVGASNMMMAGDTSETAGTILRLPEMKIGSIVLNDVGVLAAGPSTLIRGYTDLFDWYSEKSPERVAGWIGGNVVQAFRLTIDYRGRMSYWMKQSDIDSHDLDQVGLTLKRDGSSFVVVGVATKAGRPTVEGIVPGDRLLRVDDLDVTGATLGEVYAALHGRPGTTRSIKVERKDVPLAVAVPVTRF